MLSLTKEAQVALQERLAQMPAGTRVRLMPFCVGCCRKRPDVRLAYETEYDAEKDELLEFDGVPFVISKSVYSPHVKGLRVGLAGLPR